MQCPDCQHENPQEALFCMQCGANLERKCPSCNAQYPVAARFCMQCGYNLAAEVGPSPTKPQPDQVPEAERRPVTVMFCDLVGSTTLSGQLDPEVWREVVQAYQAVAADAITREEGYIAQYLGDGLLVYFGYPATQEEDALRAVRAGLGVVGAMEDLNERLQRDYDVQLAVRIGIHTGLVVVGQMGHESRQEHLALGEVPNIASRLESLASPNAVFLSGGTYRLVQGYFVCQSLGPHTLRNVSQPVEVYQALRERIGQTRLQVATERGLTPFVGRQQELAVLRGYVEEVQRGRGQVVFISGEAGIGKSRLLLEFRRSLVDAGATWREGHCISFGSHISYLPFVDLLKQTFEIDESDDEARIIQRVDEGTHAWDAESRRAVPYFKFLLSVDPGDSTVAMMDPIERAAGIFDGLRTLLVQESRQGAVVLVIEDLHWIDDPSEAALTALMDVVATIPVLCILSYRPGYTHSLGERTYYSRLALPHLPPEEGVTLIRGVLQVETLPPELGDLIANKAEGNPFYIEEVTRSLLENGLLCPVDGGYSLERPLDQIRIPDTIQEVILSRIDRLERQAREALQLAAVIGREFTVRLLKRIAELEEQLDGLLGDLKGVELIYESAYLPELAYMFKHALTQDVTYGTLLVKRRQELHRRIGAAIEDLYSDRLVEHFEVLAYHYAEGEDWPKALDYLVKAGDKSTAAYANQEGLDYYAQALEVCELLEDAVLDIAASTAEKSAWLNFFATTDYSSAAADFDRMRTCASRLEDRHLEGRALAFRGMSELWDHNFEVAEKSLRMALAVADEGFDDVRLLGNYWLAFVLMVINRHPETPPLLRKVEELTQKVDDPVSHALWVVLGSHVPTWAGRFGEALAIFERWRDAAEKIRLVVAPPGLASFLVVVNRWCEALTLGVMGQYQAALTLLEDVVELGERVGEVAYTTRAYNTIGWLYRELEDHPRAIEWNTRCVEESVRIKARSKTEVRANAQINLGDSLLALGHLDEAEGYFQQVEHVIRHPQPEDRWMLWRYAQHLFHSYGELWLTRNDSGKALAYADECLALAEQSNSRKNIVKGRRLRGQAFLTQGKLAEAEREIATALKVARQVGNPPQLWKTYAAWGDWQAAQRRPDEARRAYRNALSVIEEVAASLADQALKDTFLQSEHVQSISGTAD